MSRSNHYRICRTCNDLGGTCDFCAYYGRIHKPARVIQGRRNWERKDRFKFSPKNWHNGPPRWWWQEQHARARQVYRQMMIHDEDPALPREQDLIDLYDWY